MNAPQQLFFKRLREWRKQKAEEHGVPVYVICGNKQAVELIMRASKTIEALNSIEGFGQEAGTVESACPGNCPTRTAGCAK